MQSLANNFGTVSSLVPPVLNMVDFAHRVVGPKPFQFLSDQWMKLPGHIMPAWNPYMPRVRLLAGFEGASMLGLMCAARFAQVLVCCASLTVQNVLLADLQASAVWQAG